MKWEICYFTYTAGLATGINPWHGPYYDYLEAESEDAIRLLTLKKYTLYIQHVKPCPDPIPSST
jgi:hypothetical protein